MDDMDAERPIVEVLARGKAFLEKLLATPREKLDEDLYYTDTLVSTKRRSSLKNIQEHFRSVYQEAAEAMQNDNYERSAVRLLYAFYEAYFYNDMQDDINRILSKALKAAGGQTVEKASEILYEAMDRIMDGDLDDDFLPDFSGLEGLASGEDTAEAMQQQMAMAMQMQQQVYQAMASDDMQQLQQQMAAAMMRGDMAEYARLVAEIQKKAMGL